ncbi:MAG: hypothetical protein HYS12_09470 [Planctomycetes bacterium]|nr:hypothetical protein [Planctomycetota bacterium]
MSASAKASSFASRWRDTFTAVLQTDDVATPLKQAALAERLTDWTKHLTSAVVQSCEALGWSAAAKGFTLDLLPQVGQEYLGIDVMAFEIPLRCGVPCWLFPVAAFELENSRDDGRVAYSLWKVLCVRAGLRVVFAYRDDWGTGPG